MVGRKGRRLLSFPVVAVISLIGFVYYSTVFVFIQDWLGLESSPGFSNAVAFSCLAFMCLSSFAAAVLIDPGHVPPSFAPDVEGSQGNVIHSKYCDKCCIYKPPRSHHCRVCKRCVLKMDHHCLWINNCVGHANYKPFFIFVLYASVCSIYSMVMFMSSATQNDHQFNERYPLKLFYVSCGSVTIILSVILGTLFGWHIYLLSHNMTTIEYREGVRATWLARKSGQKYHHPFDLGIFKNLTAILGPNMLKWFCPTAVGHLKDGLQFPMYRG